MKRTCLLFAALAATAPAVAAIHDAAALRQAVYGKFTPAEFSITGRVTFVRFGNATNRPSTVVVTDETGGIAMFPATAARWDGVPRLGDLAVFNGRTYLDHGKKPCALVVRHEFLSHGVPYPPADVGISEILDGKHDFIRARLSGILRDVTGSETNPRWTMLVIYGGRNRVFASVPTTPGEAKSLKKLVGEKVSVTGICVLNDLSPRLRIGRVFIIATADDVRKASTDTATVADLPDVGRIRYENATDVEALEAHRATGCIVAVCRNRRAMLRTADGDFVGLDFGDGVLPRYGDVVTAWGLPESDLFHLHLTNAKWQKADGAFNEDEPVDVSPRAMLVDKQSNNQINSYLHGRPVSFVGVVRSVSSENSESRIVHVESDGTLVTVDATSLPNVVKSLPIGSRVAVTGVCAMEFETPRSASSFPKIGRFSIVLRKPEDISVLSRPSWWTESRLWGMISALFAVLATILVWNVALRKAATRKGRELLRAELGQAKADLKAQERTRLAVELHDSVAQMLTGISMEVEVARGMCESTSPETASHIDIAGKALKSCRDELRNCLWDLRSQALEEPDMAKAILRTLQPHVGDSRIAVGFNVPRATLSDNTAHALLSIIRELVTNALRHGEATHVKVEGTLKDGCIVCMVEDDGCGFDPDNCPGIAQGHFGLTGIQERLGPLHGTMDISSHPGKGTTVTISIPKTDDTSWTKRSKF